MSGKEYEARDCIICSRPFRLGKDSAKCCSDLCRKALWRRRHHGELGRLREEIKRLHAQLQAIEAGR